jgi:tRNA threonylcarbamoyladenosine biosynthesis protein TsaE
MSARHRASKLSAESHPGVRLKKESGVRSQESEWFRTSSDEETIELGRTLAQRLPSKTCILLIGNLGAGKTTLAKGIITGLGFAQPEEVVSPTYTLIHEYGEGRVYHIDLYRLDEPKQIATLGLDEIFGREAVVLVEWGERFPELMPAERIEIQLQSIDENTREIKVITM